MSKIIQLKHIIKIQRASMRIFEAEDDAPEYVDHRKVANNKAAIQHYLNLITNDVQEQKQICETIEKHNFNASDLTYKCICDDLRKLGYEIVQEDSKHFITLVDYRDRKVKKLIPNIENILALSMEIISGDEVLTCFYKDGSMETIDSCNDRVLNWYDDKFVLQLKDIDYYSKLKGSSYDRAQKYYNKIQKEKK